MMVRKYEVLVVILAATNFCLLVDEATAFSASAPPPPPQQLGVDSVEIPTSPLVKEAVAIYRSRVTDSMAADEEQECVDTFNELARLYGDERALDMVNSSPMCLSFDRTYFEDSLEAFGEKFGGVDKAMDMIQRNPGLLAVRPSVAAKADDSTMIMSYVVAYTRPVGALLLALLGIALLTPFVQGLTGP